MELKEKVGLSFEYWRNLLIFLIFCVCGIIAYRNTFSVPFIFDGRVSIENESRIRDIWALDKIVTGTTRPVTKLSFAINYAINKLDLYGYHAVNLAIHLLTSLVLFGLIRRTFSSYRLKDLRGYPVDTIAFAAALLWMLHPLQTESVTYIFQRSESLMGLCYLLTLYALVRGIQTDKHKTAWYIWACAFCVFGMGSKPVMLTAPLMALIYDRLFWADSWRSIWKERRKVYFGLAVTWIPLIFIALGQHESRETVGAGLKHIGPLTYAATQPGAILHYLRLVFWPYGFVLDYGWPLEYNVSVMVFSLLAVMGILGCVFWILRRYPPLGFLGIWFFLILAPTSSFFPIADPLVEHRMYLPLAAVILAFVLAIWFISRKLITSIFIRYALLGLLFMATSTFLCARTIQRNSIYHSRYSIWSDVIKKRPRNPRGHAFLANILARHGELDKAISHYKEALRLNPNFIDAHNNLALALADKGDFEEAAMELIKALELDPGNAQLYINLATVFQNLGKPDKALECYYEALTFDLDSAEIHNNLGVALANMGMLQKAIIHLEKAQALLPDDEDICNNLREAREELRNKNSARKMPILSNSVESQGYP